MKKFIFILLPLVAVNCKSLSEMLEEYHLIASEWVMDKSDELDRYLSDSNDNKKLSNTKVKVAYEFGFNSEGRFSNDFDFALSLNLPRFQDKVKVTLEKVNKYKSLINSNESFLSKSDESKIDDSYNLALQFSQWKGKKSSLYFTGGVRFNSKFLLEPYIGVITGYNIKSTDKIAFNIKNTLRYYLAGEIKDNISTQYLYNYKDDMLIGWLGNIEYTNQSDEQTLTSEFIWQRVPNKDMFYRVGFVADAKLRHFQHFKKNDFYLYYKYHNKYRGKDWLFYELTPSVEWRKEDNYHTSFGLKFKVGATFGGIRDLFNKR
jgi:hypothetical protein